MSFWSKALQLAFPPAMAYNAYSQFTDYTQSQTDASVSGSQIAQQQANSAMLQNQAQQQQLLKQEQTAKTKTLIIYLVIGILGLVGIILLVKWLNK